MKKNLSKLTIREILESYPFSRRFIVSFALDCAKDVAHLTKDPTETAKWFVVTEEYMQGRATKEELHRVINAASASAYSAASASASAAAYAASASAAANAAYAAGGNATTKENEYKQKLIKKIKGLPEFQRLILGIEI